MKSFKKGILALGLTLGIIASVGGGSSLAYGTEGAMVNGHYAKGSSYCFSSYGTGSTSYNSSGYLVVNSVYNYVNTKTLSTGTKTKSSTRNNSNYTYVDILAPNNCRSANMHSTHVVSSGGKTWTGLTDNTRYT